MELYSTWKARILPTQLGPSMSNGINMGRGEGLYRESITKSLIDHILYSGTRKTQLKVGFVGNEAAIDIPSAPSSLASMSLVFFLRSDDNKDH